MGRILAIDYGRKRTGIAVTDTLQIVANGLTTVPTHQLLTFLKQYVAKEPVERIVVGLPKQMNNEPSESMRYIKPFLAQLAKEMPQMPVEMYDERFTSVIAHRAMLDGGMKKTARRLLHSSVEHGAVGNHRCEPLVVHFHRHLRHFLSQLGEKRLDVAHALRRLVVHLLRQPHDNPFHGLFRHILLQKR